MNKINEIKDLIQLLNTWTKAYDEGNPLVSDKEWDDKYFQLKELEDKYHIYYNNSPTQTINYEVISSLEKVAHNHEMLSLEKTKSIEEVKDFLGAAPSLAMCKMDGLTCSLKYVNGKLISAETRGNGLVGENIFHNAKIILSIPKEIPYMEELIIDGEIICTYSDFEKFSSEYKNPRNFAAGSIRLLDSAECAKRDLKFIAWDVITGLNDNFLYKNLSDKLMALNKLGFEVVPYEIITPFFPEKVVDLLIIKAKEYAYPIDGLVFKFDNIEYGKSMGKTSHHFKNAIAYKFYDEIEPTKLIDIEYTMGRTGVLTPVAIFEPIELEGTTVERASLHNLSIMEELLGEMAHQGQQVEVIKANQIIPQIVSANKEIKGTLYYKEHIPFEIPAECPICGGKTEIEITIGTKVLKCTNPNCEGKLINKLDHFCGKKGLDIKGLSVATLEKLIEWEWVNCIEDIFKLEKYRTDWIKKSGFGPKSVDNILNAISASKECETNAFITSLGIPLIGETASKELVKIFATGEDFIHAAENNYDFWRLPNFGSEMHSAIINFDYTEAKKLCSDYLTFKVEKTATNSDDKDLEGLTFVITGKVNKFKNRDELKNYIENKGGKVVGSISNKTNYLINNDVESTSSKNLSAKKLGIPILSEENFLEKF